MFGGLDDVGAPHVGAVGGGPLGADAPAQELREEDPRERSDRVVGRLLEEVREAQEDPPVAPHFFPQRLPNRFLL